jgi:hypothetical protein
MEERNPDTDDLETGLHAGRPLHASLLGTQEALTLTSDLANIQTPPETRNPLWELSDDYSSYRVPDLDWTASHCVLEFLRSAHSMVNSCHKGLSVCNVFKSWHVERV